MATSLAASLNRVPGHNKYVRATQKFNDLFQTGTDNITFIQEIKVPSPSQMRDPPDAIVTCSACYLGSRWRQPGRQRDKAGRRSQFWAVGVAGPPLHHYYRRAVQRAAGRWWQKWWWSLVVVVIGELRCHDGQRDRDRERMRHRSRQNLSMH